MNSAPAYMIAVQLYVVNNVPRRLSMKRASVTAGILLLATTAAFGATAPPFTIVSRQVFTLSDKFMCQTGPALEFETTVNDRSVIYYTSLVNTRWVIARLDPAGATTEHLWFGLIRSEPLVSVIDRPFDQTRDSGPCQWIDTPEVKL